MPQSAKRAEAKDALHLFGSDPVGAPRRRHFATVTLRLIVMTALASFWLVAGAGVIGLLQ